MKIQNCLFILTSFYIYAELGTRNAADSPYSINSDKKNNVTNDNFSVRNM